MVAFDLLTDKNLLHLRGNASVNLTLLHNEVSSHLVVNYNDAGPVVTNHSECTEIVSMEVIKRRLCEVS